VPRKLLVGLPIALVCYFVARGITRTASTAMREPGIPDSLVTRPWVEQPIGLSGVSIDVPWHLEGKSVPLPKEIRVTKWAWIGHEAEGLNVMASRVVYAFGATTSLDGAADGVAEYVRRVPGTKGVTDRRKDTILFGHRAIELELSIDREKGDPVVMHAIVVLRGLELIQVMSIAWKDVPNGVKAWERIRDSARVRSG
jgi:hypothetical protein